MQTSSLPRDLRRGVIRALPFLLALSPWIAQGGAMAAVLVTLCLGWLPFTVAEGVLTRRPLVPGWLLGAVILMWLATCAGALGLFAQFQYVDGLVLGLPPGEALAAIRFRPRPLNDLAPLTVAAAIVVSTTLVMRVVVAQDRLDAYAWGAALRLAILQIAVFVLLVSALARDSFQAILAGAMVAVVVGLGVGVGLTTAAACDRIERRLWSPAPAT